MLMGGAVGRQRGPIERNVDVVNGGGHLGGWRRRWRRQRQRGCFRAGFGDVEFVRQIGGASRRAARQLGAERPDGTFVGRVAAGGDAADAVAGARAGRRDGRCAGGGGDAHICGRC